MRSPHNIMKNTLVFALLMGGVLTVSAQERSVQDLVVPAVANAGSIVEVTPGESYTLDQVKEASKGFFEYYEVPDPLYPVKSWNIKFISTDYDGSQVTIFAQFFVPDTGKTETIPTLVFAAGTTGISDQSAPSLEIPWEERWGWYRQNMLAYAGQGLIVMLPDYTGFNDPDRAQRYFSKFAEGYMMLDAIRAVGNFFKTPEGEALNNSSNQYVFTAGYSQGGHAAMAAADLRPYYAPEVPLSGMILYGSTNDVEALMREGVAYTPLILYSYREMYGADKIDISKVLLPRWIPNFDSQAQGRLPEFQSTYGFSQDRLYRPEFIDALNNGTMEEYYPELYYLMKENLTGLSGHGLPVLDNEGGKDFIVTTATQAAYVEKLRELGSKVKFLVWPNATHRYTRHAGFRASVYWMKQIAGLEN